jgi:hypothetical protein
MSFFFFVSYYFIIFLILIQIVLVRVLVAPKASATPDVLRRVRRCRAGLDVDAPRASVSADERPALTTTLAG